MKRAVSISIGSSKRDKKVEIDILGEKVSLERIGTDGDMEAAAQLYRELDGKVDAFGVGGADLGLLIDEHWYPLYSVASLVRFVKITPVVDGHGLKLTLERHIADFLEKRIKTIPRSARAERVHDSRSGPLGHGQILCRLELSGGIRRSLSYPGNPHPHALGSRSETSGGSPCADCFKTAFQLGLPGG